MSLICIISHLLLLIAPLQIAKFYIGFPLRNIYNHTSFIPKIITTISNDNLNDIKNPECTVL